MPYGNRRGPTGMGPMTGRGAGYCTGNSTPGYMNPMNRGMNGGGRGMRHRHLFFATGMSGLQRGGRGGRWGGAGYYPNADIPFTMDDTRTAMNKDQELHVLKEQAQYLETTLSDITERIKELEVE